MPVGNFTLFDRAVEKIARGTIDLDSQTFKCALTTSAQSLDKTFAGTSTDARYADLTAQVANGNGYTTGGITLTIAISRSGGTVTVDSTVDPNWTTSTITAKYAVIYSDTAANKDLLGFVDLETGGGSVSSTNADFQVQWNASGLFTMTS